MKKAYYLITILFFIFCFSACNDEHYPIAGEVLSGGYVCKVEGTAFLRPSNMFKPSVYGDIVDYSYNNDFIIAKQKPNKENYVIFIAEELMSFRTMLSSDSLQCKPEEYKFYKNLIRKNRDLMSKLFSELSPNHNSDDMYRSQIIADSLIQHNSFYKSIFKNEINYWIISHKEINSNDYMPMSKIYGPYNLQEYLKKKEELGVPIQMKLK